MREPEIETRLRLFLARAKRRRFGCREWIGDGVISVYLRFGHHSFDGETLTDSLDIANVDVAERHQKQGHFTRFLALAERLNPWPVLYLENVHNPVLLPLVERSGFVPHPSLSACFFKKTANPAEPAVSM